MKYYQATVTTTSEFADTLSVILMDFGSDGVAVNDYEDVKAVLNAHTWDYADESLLDARSSDVYVSGYYPEDYDFSALTEKLNDLKKLDGILAGSLELDLKKIDSADYENEWKKYYRPIELSKIVIVPKWLSYKGAKLPVFIDPGMAFGTGSHETTKLCLKLIEHAGVAGKNCADIGCGSGILGAAMLRLGAKKCYMADTDMQAVEAAKQNCGLNGVSDCAEIVCGTLDGGRKNEFSVVVANITADVLIALEKDICEVTESGGTLILSGIIHSRADDVISAYGKHFKLISAERDGEWQGLLWKKA